MLWPTKNLYKEFDNEKQFLRLENSPPPPNCSNGPSLNGAVSRKSVKSKLLEPPPNRAKLKKNLFKTLKESTNNTTKRKESREGKT